MTGPPPHSKVLGVFPTSRGFGYAIFNGPFALVDAGDVVLLRHKNQAALDRIARLLARHEPQALVLEAYEGPGTKRCERIKQLSASIFALAADRGHHVEVYPRNEVQETFAEEPAATRDEVAAAVAKRVPALAVRLPRPRRSFDSEDKRLAIFSAAALVLTFYRKGATALLDELRNAA